MSVQNDCARSDWMDVSIVSTEWLCLFNEQMCLFGTVALVSVCSGITLPNWCVRSANNVSDRNGYVHSNWTNLSIQDGFAHSDRTDCLLRKTSTKFLYKGQNSTSKRMIQKTKNNNNHKNKWVQENCIEFLSEFCFLVCVLFLLPFFEQVECMSQL